MQIYPEPVFFLVIHTSPPQLLGSSCRFCQEPNPLTLGYPNIYKDWSRQGWGASRVVHYPSSPRYGPAFIATAQWDPLHIVFRNHRHRVPHLGTNVCRILPSLEEEGSFLSPRPRPRSHLGQCTAAGQDRQSGTSIRRMGTNVWLVVGRLSFRTHN